MKKLSFMRGDIFSKFAVHTPTVVCLKGEKYAPLFCRQLVSFLANRFGRTIFAADIHEDDFVSTMSSLQTTFLGTQHLYWLKSDELLSKKMHGRWHDYLASYQGPHTIVFFTSNGSNIKRDGWYVIDVPTEITKADFYEIAHMMEGRKEVADTVFKRYQSIPLDTAVLFVHYSKILGKNFGLFMEDHAHELLAPEQSLFTLSQAFFSRKYEHFFVLWRQMQSTYSLPFWVSFWSEQLWQAYVYIKLQRAGEGISAKKHAYRLPFSFCNRDWRRYVPEAIKRAYNSLYQFDFHLKNGGSPDALELFYFNFMGGIFDKECVV